jgi:hypothetical protein
LRLVTDWLAPVLVLAAGIYLVVLGAISAVRPESAKRFLATFASSVQAHFLELFVRFVIGFALILSAPQMRFSALFVVFGWALVGTTIVLLAIPWRWHRRFARWSVPLATRSMTLFAIGPLAGGVLVLASLLL